MSRPLLQLPAVRCPACGAVEGDLRCMGSRRIGRTRTRDYLCRNLECRLTFVVHLRLDWKPDDDAATAVIVLDRPDVFTKPDST